MTTAERYLHSMFAAVFAVGMLFVAAEFTPSVSALITEGLLAIGLIASFRQATKPKEL